MTNELKNIRFFFTDRRRKCLSVKAIEEEAKIPAKSLEHMLSNRRGMSEKNIRRLTPVLQDFGYKCSEEDQESLKKIEEN